MPIDLPVVSFDTSTRQHDAGRLKEATTAFTKAKGNLGSRLNRTVQIVADEHSDTPEGIEAAAQFMDGLATFLGKEGPDIAEALHRQITSGPNGHSDKGDTIQVTQLREEVQALEASKRTIESDRARLADAAEHSSNDLAKIQERHQRVLIEKDRRIESLGQQLQKAAEDTGANASQISALKAENEQLKQAASGNADQALTAANAKIAELESENAQLKSDKQTLEGQLQSAGGTVDLSSIAQVLGITEDATIDQIKAEVLKVIKDNRRWELIRDELIAEAKRVTGIKPLPEESSFRDFMFRVIAAKPKFFRGKATGNTSDNQEGSDA